MPESRKRALNRLFLRVIVPVGAAAGAFLWRQEMVRHFGPGFPPYLAALPAVMLVGLAAGLWAGLLATATSAVLAWFWVLPPQGTFRIQHISDAVGLILFVVVGAGMSLVAELYHDNRRKSLAFGKALAQQESEAQFRTLANAIPQLCWMANADGGIFWYNQRWYDYTGTTPEQMEGWGWQSVHDPEVLPEVLERWKTALTTAQPFDMVFPLRGADGEFHPFLTRVMPVCNRNGQVVRWFGSNTDISEQRQTEEKLAYQVLLNKSITDNAPVSIVVTDNDGHLTFVNPEAEKVFGFTRDEMTGKLLHDLVHHHHLDGRLFAADDCLLMTGCKTGETVCDYEDVFYRKDGEPINVSCSNAPFEMEGHFRGSVLLIRNITERKRAVDKLKESEGRYRSLFENMLDGFAYCQMLYDEFGRPVDFVYLGVNSAFEKLTGLENVVDRKVSEVIPGIRETNPELLKIYGRVARSGTPERFEVDLKPLGVWFSVSVYSTQRDHFVAIFDNITARKHAELARAHQAQELARSNAELEQFAYVASHDLQEPLRTIAGFAQLLAKRYQGRLDTDADEFIAYLVEGAGRMQELIQGLLAYARVGSRGSGFSVVDSGLALQRALSNLQHAIAEAQATITHDALPAIHADSVQLVQVFQNLIANAIKFRADRPPRVHVSAQKVDGTWRFSVRDNGIGIAPEHRERIFLIFQRLHSRREYSGTGVGLAICRRIAERHQGQIWVESEPGKGATFYFTISGKGTA